MADDDVDMLLLPGPAATLVEEGGMPHDAVKFTYDEVLSQNKLISEELAQCKADKEFVWNLWKQLQSSKPEISEAIESVLQREKLKAEAKNVKVLKILQQKDDQINSLQKISDELEGELKTSSDRLTTLIYDQTQWGSTVLELESKIKKQNEELLGQQNNWHEKSTKQIAEISSMKLERKTLIQANQDLQAIVQTLTAKWKSAETDLEANQLCLKDFENLRGQHESVAKELEVERNEAAEMSRKEKECRQLLDIERNRNSKYKTQTEKLKSELNLKRRNLECHEKTLQDQLRQIQEQEELLRQMEAIQRDTQNGMKEMKISHQQEVKSLKDSIESLVRNSNSLRDENAALKSKTEQMIADHGYDARQRDAELDRLRFDPSALLHEPTGGRINGHGRCDNCLRVERDAMHIERNLTIMSEALQEKSRAISALETELIERRRHGDQSRDEMLAKVRIDEERTIGQLNQLIQTQADELQEIRRAHHARLQRYKTLKADYKLIVQLLRTYDNDASRDNTEERRSSTPKRRRDKALNENQSMSTEKQLALCKHECNMLKERQQEIEDESNVLRVERANFLSVVNELKVKLDQRCRELDIHREEFQRRQHYVSPSRLKMIDQQSKAFEMKARLAEERLTEAECLNDQLTQQQSLMQHEIKLMSKDLITRSTFDAQMQTDDTDAQCERRRKGNFTRDVLMQTSPWKRQRELCFDQWTQTSGASSSEESDLDITPRMQSIGSEDRVRMDKSDVFDSFPQKLPNRVCGSTAAFKPRRNAGLTRRPSSGRRSRKDSKALIQRISSMENQIAALQEEKQTSSKRLLEMTADKEQQNGKLIAIQQKLFAAKQTVQRQSGEINRITMERDHVTIEQKKERGKSKIKDAAVIRDLEDRLRANAENCAQLSLESKTLRRENETLEMKLKDYTERVLKLDRMLHQRRLLVDDLREKQRTLQSELATEKEALSQFQKKAKSLTDRDEQRRSLMENMKTKLSAAMEDKYKMHRTCLSVQDELAKKVVLLKETEAMCVKAEHAIVDIEASWKLRFEKETEVDASVIVQKDAEINLLRQCIGQHEAAVKGLYGEMLRQIRECRLVLKERQRKTLYDDKRTMPKQENQSMRDAKSKACAILDISSDDLDAFLLVNGEEDDCEFDIPAEAVEKEIWERLSNMLESEGGDFSSVLFHDVMQLVDLAFRFKLAESNAIN